MNDNFEDINIIDKSEFNSFENKFINNITDIVELGNKLLIKLKQDNITNLLDNGSITHNVNIAISSAITAYSRIHMSQFKNNPEFKLFYSDTDSIYINKPLPESLVSNNELGKLKLEYICNKGVFIAPKVYGLITNNNQVIIKIKGLTKETIEQNVTIKLLEELLIKDSKLEIPQNKWYKSIIDSNITIKEQLYTLKVTDNKRELIYVNNKLVNTKPLTI